MAKELSDFLKTAYKYGKVKDLKLAFKEFPVEEEGYKGKPLKCYLYWRNYAE